MLITAIVNWAGRQGIIAVIFLISLLGFKEAYHLFRSSSVNVYGSCLFSSVLIFLSMGGLAWHVYFNNFMGMQELFLGQVLVLLLIGTKSQDIFAYFTGSLIGRHPLAPSISPNKTWEGALGGVLGSGLITWVVCVIGQWETPFPAFFYGIVLGLGSLGGDLIESKLKRKAKKKDSGHLVPGFGGILDMIDSLILAAPLSWLAWQTMSKNSMWFME